MLGRWVMNRLGVVSSLPMILDLSDLKELKNDGVMVIDNFLDNGSLEDYRMVMEVIRFQILPEILKYPKVLLNIYPLDILVSMFFKKVYDSEIIKLAEKIDYVLRKLYFCKIFLILDNKDEKLRKLYLDVYKNHCMMVVDSFKLKDELKAFLLGGNNNGERNSNN